MEKGTTFVGLDVHKEAINVAMLLAEESRPMEWQTSKRRGGGSPAGEEAPALGDRRSAAVLRGGPVWLRGPADDPRAGSVVRRGRPVARPAQTGRAGRDGPP
jgi:hypothetical protein